MSVSSIAEDMPMSMPAQLTARLAEALSALYCHPERALLSWYRYAIYTALTIGEPVRGGAARARLDILAVRRVLFCWPHDAGDLRPAPQQLLALAEQLLVGTADRAGIGKQLNRAHALADIAGADPTSPRYCGWCVYEAALRALGSACAYDQLRGGQASYDVANCADDASTYAAIAVAGGAWHSGHWDWQTEDAQLRRAVFWEWWLREAVPAAWLARF
jgi:hypothetical protein